MPKTLLVASLVACAAGLRVDAPSTPARPDAIKALTTLRGGATKRQVALTANAIVSGAYGLGLTLAPTKVVAIYGSAEKVAAMSAASNFAQYLGCVNLVLAFRCVAALGCFASLPKRDVKETLGDMCLYHMSSAAVSGIRAFELSKTSLLAATGTPLPGSLALAAFSAIAARAES